MSRLVYKGRIFLYLKLMNEIKLLVTSSSLPSSSTSLTTTTDGLEGLPPLPPLPARKLSPSRDNCSFGPPHRFSTGHLDLSSKLHLDRCANQDWLFCLVLDPPHCPYHPMYARHGMHEHALPLTPCMAPPLARCAPFGTRVEISCMDLLPCACIGEQLNNSDL